MAVYPAPWTSQPPHSLLCKTLNMGINPYLTFYTRFTHMVMLIHTPHERASKGLTLGLMVSHFTATLRPGMFGDACLCVFVFLLCDRY